ncbi:MAG: leucine--tRNA ligase [Trueperaceae bacterium]|nr:leucine--tRNA ligase [Trueperaceae bacterium]
MSEAVKEISYESTRYNPHAIEPKWQKKWEEAGLYKVDLSDQSKPKYYFLTMYPYPSGDLHTGHWYAEAPADAAARYLRMKGFNVLFPMGFDAFGLPAENAAIKAARRGENVHPATLTYKQIDRMVKQFAQMGAMFDWSKMIATCDPDYYKWNQWFFLKMYEKGLAYKKQSPVDWCPSCNTTLAREQVIGDDRVCERCGTPVIKKDLSQWYLKITDYAEELLNFEGLDWPARVREMQTNWIGRSEGAEVNFETPAGPLTVFTTRPDTLWGASFMVLAPEHPFVAELTSADKRTQVDAYVEEAKRKTEIDRLAEGKEKTGVFIGAYAKNPVTGRDIPIWIADYVLMGYGTGAIMAVPYGDQRDFEFARKFGLDIIPVVKPDDVETVDVAGMDKAYDGPGTMINSGPINGKIHNGEKGQNSPAIAATIEYLEGQNLGKAAITYRLRDWLISRQRYWGTPFPIIYCEEHGAVAVPYETLPVELPTDVEFMPTGESPLKSHESFLNTTCPICGKAATRETDTMDTFMDSSWYWFRYLTPHKEDGPLDAKLAKHWTPVDTYTGGIEHAILHLMYARFFTKVIRDLGLIQQDEPFKRLRNQGIILGEDNEKMSKSRGNVVNPDDLVAEYGADTVRTYLMFIGPWDQGGPWNSKGIEGPTRFLGRSWTLVTEEPTNDEAITEKTLKELKRAVHTAIKEVTDDFENFQFNTAIAELMTLVNVMNKAKSKQVVETLEWQEGIEGLIKMLAPIAPHIAEELWERSNHKGSIHLKNWPSYDETALVKDSISMAVQVNGKVRGQIEVATDASKDDILDTAKAESNVARYLDNAQIVREIVVPGKLVNLVIKA